MENYNYIKAMKNTLELEKEVAKLKAENPDPFFRGTQREFIERLEDTPIRTRALEICDKFNIK